MTASKSSNQDSCEYRDFGCVPWFLAMAAILGNGRDFRRIKYKISTVQLLCRQIGYQTNGSIQCSQTAISFIIYVACILILYEYSGHGTTPLHHFYWCYWTLWLYQLFQDIVILQIFTVIFLQL